MFVLQTFFEPRFRKEAQKIEYICWVPRRIHQSLIHSFFNPLFFRILIRVHLHSTRSWKLLVSLKHYKRHKNETQLDYSEVGTKNHLINNCQYNEGA